MVYWQRLVGREMPVLIRSGYRLQNVAVARANKVKTNAVADVTMNAEADLRYPNLLRPMTEINPRAL